MFNRRKIKKLEKDIIDLKAVTVKLDLQNTNLRASLNKIVLHHKFMLNEQPKYNVGYVNPFGFKVLKIAGIYSTPKSVLHYLFDREYYSSLNYWYVLEGSVKLIPETLVDKIK